MNSNNYSIDRIIKENLKMDGEFPIKTTIKTFPKGAVIMKHGDVFEFNIFVISGIVQFSTHTKDNQEKILDFIFPNEFFGVYSFNFPYRAPLIYTIVCLTECKLEMIPVKEYWSKVESSLLLNRLSLFIYEYWYVKRMQKENDMLTKSAEEKYYSVLKTRPELVKYLPVSKIAKYLGIHPDSLSRIRKSAKLIAK